MDEVRSLGRRMQQTVEIYLNSGIRTPNARSALPEGQRQYYDLREQRRSGAEASRARFNAKEPHRLLDVTSRRAALRPQAGADRHRRVDRDGWPHPVGGWALPALQNGRGA